MQMLLLKVQNIIKLTENGFLKTNNNLLLHFLKQADISSTQSKTQFKIFISEHPLIDRLPNIYLSYSELRHKLKFTVPKTMKIYQNVNLS